MKKDILKHVYTTCYANLEKHEQNVLLVSIEDGSYEVNASWFTDGKITDQRSIKCANLKEASTQFNQISIELVNDLWSKAKLYKTDGTILEVVPANGTDFQLEELQSYVNGYIDVLDLNDNQIIVLNDEGKLQGLPVNEKATEIFRDTYPTTDFIVGDVLICDSKMVL